MTPELAARSRQPLRYAVNSELSEADLADISRPTVPDCMGATRQDTLELHRRGKTAVEIAAVRELAVGTIKSHLARMIANGVIDVYEVLPAATIDPVVTFMRENAHATLTEIRRGTGDRYDYNDLRMIVAHQTRCRRSEGTGSESTALP